MSDVIVTQTVVFWNDETNNIPWVTVKADGSIVYPDGQSTEDQNTANSLLIAFGITAAQIAQGNLNAQG